MKVREIARLEVDAGLADRLYRLAGAERWKLQPGAWGAALEASVSRGLEGTSPGPRAAIASARASLLPDGPRYVARITQALGRAVSRLAARDRLRLGCYYAQELTLAQIGRLLREHEATVSRHLARTRRAIREDIE